MKNLRTNGLLSWRFKSSRRRALFFGLLSVVQSTGLALFWNARSATAADAPVSSLTPIVRQAVRVGVSPSLRSIDPKKLAARSFDGAPRVIPLHRLRREKTAAAAAAAAPAAAGAERDPVVQRFARAAKTPAPSLAFEGISNADNELINGYPVWPPDPVGDVGPDHYVQAVNTLMKVFDKNGTSLAGPTPISELYAGFGGPCEDTNDGDAIVLYDHLADRWMISQFANVFVGPRFHQCIAISQGGDPTGTYFLYDFPLPLINLTDSKLNDYPKFGVWPDAYYMSDNQFNAAGTSFLGVGVFAFERDKMLTGDPASYIYFDLGDSGKPYYDPFFYSMLPADLDGPAPPAGTPNYFAYYTANEFGEPQDGLRIFEFHVDFATPADSTFTERAESPITTAPFDPNIACGVFGRSCIPQKGTANKVDAIADNLMFRLQYRNFGTHESLVTNHTVDADINHAGIRYYELRRSLPGGNFVVNEQATFAPDSNHRWMGSAAMDSMGNIAVGYSVSGANLYPSIRYASRLATDPPGGLFQSEATLQNGGGSQTGSSRWGDYSALSVDPVQECTFWYTQEYYATTSPVGWRTKIGSFTLPGCIHDLAVVRIRAKSTVKAATAVTAGVAVTIQNRSDHSESIDSADLDDGVSSGLVRLDVSIVDPGNVEVCQDAVVVLDNARNAALFSRGAKILKPKQMLTVNFFVTYECTNAQPLDRRDPDRGDYEHVATVYHEVLDGNPDDHAADDSCPHDPLPGNLDSNPPPRGVRDNGCGNRKPDRTLGAVVQTDVIR